METHRLLWLFIAVTSSTGHARDVVFHLKIAEALKLDAAKQLDPDIALYLGDQPVPAGATTGDAVSQQKERISEADELACASAMLKALLELQTKARSSGADAVIAIESRYKQASFASRTEYECHCGTSTAVVSLFGRFLRMAAQPPTCRAESLPAWSSATAKEKRELVRGCRGPRSPAPTWPR
jgi:uncharacterized protein YbjQ (UPF0145 family)